MKINLTENILKTDIAIIGSGAAGTCSAIEAHDCGKDVLIVSKGKAFNSGSTFGSIVPGWGIQLITKEDGKNTYDNFLKEVIKVGEGMADPLLAKILISKTPARVYELEKWGINFCKINNKFYKTLCCFAETEREVADAFDLDNIRKSFSKEIIKRKIKIIENFTVVKILLSKTAGMQTVCGLIGIDKKDELVFIKAKAIIIASGGCASIFPNNLSSPELIGDGYKLALEAGAKLINMEYIQFIYGMLSPKLHLYDKIIKFPDAILNKNKKQFLEKRIPHGMSINKIVEDRVKYGPFTSRLPGKYFDFAIESEIQNGFGTRRNGFYLNLENIEVNIGKLSQNYPTIVDWLEWLKKKNILNNRDKLEIGLCAHANNGGILVSLDTMTNIGGLFACGEVMGGAHGADREGGNMMASTIVFGRIAGRNAAAFCNSAKDYKVHYEDMFKSFLNKNKFSEKNYYTSANLKKEIKGEVGKALIINRNGKTLKMLLLKVEDFYEKINYLDKSEKNFIKNYFDLESMILTVEIIAKTADFRKESRGSHYRNDYPDIDNDNYSNILKVSLLNKKINLDF